MVEGAAVAGGGREATAGKAAAPEPASAAGGIAITAETVREYVKWLEGEERAKNTVDKYRRDLESLRTWLGGRPLTRELAAGWKDHLQSRYAAASVNSMLAAANGFFQWLGVDGLRLRFLKVQRRAFCDCGRELDRREYERLVSAARASGQERLALAMETLCGMGLRVSELRFVTVEAARAGRAEIRLKGKVRAVAIPGKLARKLLRYAKGGGVSSGAVFVTGGGGSLSRGQIWREMKRLCERAGVEPSKVFPHNLRHLFARVHYGKYRDMAKLADILGHSSVETTRVYLVTAGDEHARQIEQLGLVV